MIEDLKGLFGYTEDYYQIIRNFFARGKGALVKEAIVGSEYSSADSTYCLYIRDAITLSLNEDRRDRVIDLMKVVQARLKKEEFEIFMAGVIERYLWGEDSMPLKRFFTLHREELSKKYPDIHETICSSLVHRLKYSLLSQT